MSVAFGALETTAFIIMTLIMLTITIYTSIQTIPKLIKKKISCLNISSLLSLLFYFLTGLFYLTHVIAKLYSNQSALADNIRRAGGGCYMIGQWWMTLNFINRLIFIFSTSTFQISNCMKKSLYIPFYSSLIVGAFGAVIARIFELTTLYIIAAVLWLIVHITLSITLIILFIHKIRIVTLNTICLRSHSTLPTNSDMIDKNSDRITNSLVNMELLDVAIKNGVLVPIAIISSLLSMVFALTFSVIPRFYLLPPVFMVFDSTLTSICIFLLFSSNVHIYNKLCNKCHAICAKWQLNSFKTK
eukprot:442184_1